jgi:hypothetical protein
MDCVDNRTGIYHTFKNGERREIVIELADEADIEELRALSPEERLARAAFLSRTRRRALRKELELLHPAWSEEQLRQEVVRRYFSDFG